MWRLRNLVHPSRRKYPIRKRFGYAKWKTRAGQTTRTRINSRNHNESWGSRRSITEHCHPCFQRNRFISLNGPIICYNFQVLGYSISMGDQHIVDVQPFRSLVPQSTIYRGAIFLHVVCVSTLFNLFIIWKGEETLVFLAGILLGLSTLIRPIGIGLFVVFGIIIWLQADNSQLKPKLMLIGFFLIGLFITVTPWATYIKYHTGKFTLQPNHVHAARSLIEGLTFGTQKKGYRIGIPLRPDVKAFIEEMEPIFFHYQTLPDGPKLYGPGGSYDIQKPGNIVRIVLTKGLDKPIVFMRFALLKLTRAWYGTDSNRYERIASYLQFVYFLAIIPAIVLILYRRENRLLARIAIGISLYFWLLASIFTPLVRYMIPALGLLFTLIPALWATKSSNLRRIRSP
jgi:hypothetical protein